MKTTKNRFNCSFFKKQILGLSILLFSATINALSGPSLQQIQEEKTGQWQFKYYAINKGKLFRSDLEYNNHPSSFVFLTRTPIAFNHDWFDGCIMHCV